MSVFNSKGSHLAELIHELTNMDLDSSNITRYGHLVAEGDLNVNAIRATRYMSRVEDSSSYQMYINNLSQQSLTELAFLQLDECYRLLKRFDLIAEQFDKAWKLYFVHYETFYNGSFSSIQFEWAFFHLFNIPVRRSGAYENPNFGDLKTTSDFWMDLQDALMYKQGALLWVTHELREIYGIPHPPEKKDTLETVAANPDKPKNETSPVEMFAVVQDILAPLSKNFARKKIMTDVEFARLIEYTNFLVVFDDLPKDIQVIPHTNVSAEHIRYTFHRLHKALFSTNRIRQTFIDFLHAVFSQFGTQHIKTTRGKFGTPPLSYNTDFNISL